MPTDDELDRLLKQVPQTAPSASAPLDEGRLLDWRAGKLSDAEAEAIERRLATDPEARALLRELSRGSSPEEVEGVLGAVQPRAKVLPLRRAPIVIGVVTALAAALVFFVTRQPPLPTYRLELEGGVAEARSELAKGAVLLPDSRLVVRLRAGVETDTPLVLGVFRENAAGRLERVEGGALKASRGTFEFVIDGQTLLRSTGRHRVWLHVARDEAALRAAEGSAPAEGAGWWAFDTELRAP